MISVRTRCGHAKKQGTLGLSVRLFDLSRGMGLATYRGRNLSQRGLLAPGRIHPEQSNTFSPHPTDLTWDGEAEPFSLTFPVQNSMIPVISHLVTEYQQASTWEWKLQFRTVTPLGLLESHDRGGTKPEGPHSTAKEVLVIVGPNAPPSQVSVDDSLI